jgi:hypothetical protein
MPRSRKRIDEDSAARTRCKAIIKTATDSFVGKLDAPSIVQKIQWHQSKEVESDRPLLRYLWGKGLEAEVRAALAEWGLITTGDEAPPQLELFAEHERPIVKQIGMARIWLPRQQEHVQYHDLSDTDLDASGSYYEAHGRGEIRKGVLLHQLAAMRRERGPSTAAVAA